MGEKKRLRSEVLRLRELLISDRKDAAEKYKQISDQLAVSEQQAVEVRDVTVKRIKQWLETINGYGFFAEHQNADGWAALCSMKIHAELLETGRLSQNEATNRIIKEVFGEQAPAQPAPAVQQGAGETSDLPAAAIACDVCGSSEPHFHDDTEVQIERYARKAFEMWYALAMRSESLFRVENWGNPSQWAERIPSVFGKPSGPYCDAKVESYWKAFKAAWLCQPDRLAPWNLKFHFDSCGNVIDLNDPEKVAAAFGMPSVSWRPASAQPAEPAPKQFRVRIDRQEFSTASERLTGAQLRCLPEVPISSSRDLWHDELGGPDTKINDADAVDIHDYIRFFTAPAQIVAGQQAEPASEDAIAELEKWKREHKGHSAEITHDDGYGASCGWEVILYINQKDTIGPIVACEQTACETHICVGTEDNDWPGLAPVILAAIKAARAEEAASALQPQGEEHGETGNEPS
jgi:hypothetical protein